MNTRKIFSFILFVCVLLTAWTQAAAPTALLVSVTPTIVVPTATLPATIPPELTAFKSKVFELPMTVSFGQQDWHVSDDFVDLVTIDSSQGDWGISFNLVTDAKLANPSDGQLIPFPKEYVSWIQSNPDFKVDQPTRVTIGGIDGAQIDATPIWTSATTNKKQFLVLRLDNWNIVTKPERWRFIYLNNVNGERLLVMLIAAADQFDTATEQAQAVLNTVEFTCNQNRIYKVRKVALGSIQ
jgi:hypothetical protein